MVLERYLKGTLHLSHLYTGSRGVGFPQDPPLVLMHTQNWPMDSSQKASTGWDLSIPLLLILAMIINEETLLEQVLTGQKQKSKPMKILKAQHGDGPRRNGKREQEEEALLKVS